MMVLWKTTIHIAANLIDIIIVGFPENHSLILYEKANYTPVPELLACKDSPGLILSETSKSLRCGQNVDILGANGRAA
jgi:hypothetical protein